MMCPGVDELLHVVVVDRDAPQALVTEQVGAGVADVGEAERLVAGGCGDDDDGGDGGAHALLCGVGGGGVEDVGVGVADGGDEGVEPSRGALEVGGHARDGEGAGDLTRLVATHAVGDDEEALAHEQAVLVLGADHALVGDGTPVELGHYCASSTV
ncbi:MAG: hypothetical protein WKF58_15835 [Ilumatobacteraceae bacterium]